MEAFGSFSIARVLFLRSLATIYFVAFLVALKQFPALLGQNGLLPVPQFIHEVPFKSTPSLFYLAYSDQLLQIVACSGMAISVGLFSELLDRGPWWCTTGLWLVLWILLVLPKKF